MTIYNERARAHFENLTGTIAQKLGGDFDSDGLVRGIEKSLAPFVLGADTVYMGKLKARHNGLPETRNTDLGMKVGEIIGRAYILGTTVEETPHV